jgi:hypothetical protein
MPEMLIYTTETKTTTTTKILIKKNLIDCKSIGKGHFCENRKSNRMKIASFSFLSRSRQLLLCHKRIADS